ncbi:hypothetical protein SUNI508_12224 [Seiridium unicorne]|uniref:Uncharacterized protein n=1 Tax=Seiridium unicorne TaxID=138068 RepID=A0ABR2UEU7_9PEZI
MSEWQERRVVSVANQSRGVLRKRRIKKDQGPFAPFPTTNRPTTPASHMPRSLLPQDKGIILCYFDMDIGWRSQVRASRDDLFGGVSRITSLSAMHSAQSQYLVIREKRVLQCNWKGGWQTHPPARHGPLIVPDPGRSPSHLLEGYMRKKYILKQRSAMQLIPGAAFPGFGGLADDLVQKYLGIRRGTSRPGGLH